MNGVIAEDIPVVCEDLPYEEAMKRNAVGVFQNKYGEVVKVYTIGDVSTELCGGPHVKSTGEIGSFRITKEESSAAGVRRIKATVE